MEKIEKRLFAHLGSKIEFLIEPQPGTGDYLVVTATVTGAGESAVVTLSKKPAGQSSALLAKFPRMKELTKFYSLDSGSDNPIMVSPDAILVAKFDLTDIDQRFTVNPSPLFTATHGHHVEDQDAQVPLLMGIVDGKEADPFLKKLRENGWTPLIQEMDGDGGIKLNLRLHEGTPRWRDRPCG